MTVIFVAVKVGLTMITEKYYFCVGSVFSLLSAEDREKLKRASDNAKEMAAGKTALHGHGESMSQEASSKADDVSTDGEYVQTVTEVSFKAKNYCNTCMFILS